MPIETFPTTLLGHYVRGVRAYHQSYYRLLIPGKDQLQAGDQYWDGIIWQTVYCATWFAVLVFMCGEFVYRRRETRERR